MMRLPAALFVFAVGSAHDAVAADIRLSSAWLRPVQAGASARVYVDIASDEALTLVRVTTPAAKSVEIRIVDRTDGSDEGTAVKTQAIGAHAKTRFAYLGDHLRLVGVNRDLMNGASVPLALEFADPGGKTQVATIDATVRGFMPPRAAVPANVPPPVPVNADDAAK
jgi:copper(I)-binding protein